MTNLLNKTNDLTIIWPELLDKKIDNNQVELHLFVSDKLHYFKGHFPESPILAGVVQLHWVVEYAKSVFNLSDDKVANLEVLKFQVVIIPNQHLILTLTQKPNDKVVFTYTSERSQHASGRVVFGS